MDVKQIRENRKLMRESTIESPICPTIEDTDADYADRLYNQLPADELDFIPFGKKE